MSRISACCEWLLRQPVVWGALACFAFQVTVVQNLPADSVVRGWFAGEAFSLKLITSLLFFTAAAALGLTTLRLAVQFGAIARCRLTLPSANTETSGEVERLLAELDGYPKSLRECRLAQRLRAALEHVRQIGAAGLAAQLAQLAEKDRRDIQQADGGVRTIAICIPLVGLLGGVSGLTTALAALEAGGNATAASLAGGRTALEIVGQALAASTALLLMRAVVRRLETRLASSLDAAAERQLLGRWGRSAAGGDAGGGSVVRLCEQVLDSVRRAVSEHDATLTKTLSVAGRRWEETASTAAALLHRTVGEALTAGLKEHAQSLNDGVAKHTSGLQNVLVRHAEILSDNIDGHTGALADALEQHAAVLTQCETNLAAENRRCLGELEAALGEAVLVASTRQEKLIKQSEELLCQMQTALVESAGVAVAQQEQLARQGEVLLRVVEATGQVRRLEDALNGNLAALAGAHHFEETVVSLAAALQLLSAQLGRPHLVRDGFSIEGDQRTSQAA